VGSRETRHHEDTLKKQGPDTTTITTPFLEPQRHKGHNTDQVVRTRTGTMSARIQNHYDTTRTTPFNHEIRTARHQETICFYRHNG
jgi:hypothetical protein